MWFKYALKAQKLIAQGNGRKQHALKGRVFKIRIKNPVTTVPLKWTNRSLI